MTAEVVFTNHAADKLRALRHQSPGAAQAIMRTLAEINEESAVEAKRVAESSEGQTLYSITRGDLRILYTLSKILGKTRVNIVGVISRADEADALAEVREVLASANN